MPDIDLDDEAPPDLVEVGTDGQLEEITVKVPITIVTGEYISILQP